MSQPIVVGVDGSEHADRAVDWAATEANLRHRRLHIVHAVENWPYGAPLFAPAETIGLMSRVGRGVLVAVAERVREQWPDLEVSTALVSDDAPLPAGTTPGLTTMLSRVLDLMLAANEQAHNDLAERGGAMIVRIPTGYASSFDRNMSMDTRLRLYHDGYVATAAAVAHLEVQVVA